VFELLMLHKYITLQRRSFEEKFSILTFFYGYLLPNQNFFVP